MQVQLNVEFFYRLLYNCLHGACTGNVPVNTAAFSAWLAQLWLWIVVIGYVLSCIAFFIIVYLTVRLFELRKKEEAQYQNIVIAPAAVGTNPRWKHIETLMAGDDASKWREAILEADIMLDDMLGRQGYQGEGVGEKLKSVEPSDFATLDDAWEAHKVRNQIAHKGSAFNLSEMLAHRTLARYENVFREFELI